MKQSITVLDAANQPTGPFSIQDVRQKLASGEFKAAQLAHTEGLGSWTPLSDVLAFLDKQNPPAAAVTTQAPSTIQPTPAQTPVTQTPISTVTSQPSFSSQPAATTTQPSFSTASSQPSFATPSSQPSFASPQPNYAVAATAGVVPTGPGGFRIAEFWKRLVAYIVDGLLISIITSVPNVIILFAFVMPDTNNNNAPNPFYFLGMLLISLITMIVFTLYFGFMEGLSSHASLGKMIFGLKVVDAQGNGLPMGQSFLRSFVKAFLITLPCCIGPILAIVSIVTILTANGKALHDMIIGTSVIEPPQ